MKSITGCLIVACIIVCIAAVLSTKFRNWLDRPSVASVILILSAMASLAALIGLVFAVQLAEGEIQRSIEDAKHRKVRILKALSEELNRNRNTASFVLQSLASNKDSHPTTLYTNTVIEQALNSEIAFPDQGYFDLVALIKLTESANQTLWLSNQYRLSKLTAIREHQANAELTVKEYLKFVEKDALNMVSKITDAEKSLDIATVIGDLEK